MISAISCAKQLRTGSLAFNFITSCKTPNASPRTASRPCDTDKMFAHVFRAMANVSASTLAWPAGSPRFTCNNFKSASNHSIANLLLVVASRTQHHSAVDVPESVGTFPTLMVTCDFVRTKHVQLANQLTTTQLFPDRVLSDLYGLHSSPIKLLAILAASCHAMRNLVLCLHLRTPAIAAHCRAPLCVG